MDLPDRCVVDSNIWMDLDAGGLLSAVFVLTSAKTRTILKQIPSNKHQPRP